MMNVELIALLVLPVALYICFIGNLFRVKLCRNSEEPPLSPSPIADQNPDQNPVQNPVQNPDQNTINIETV